MHDRCVPGQNSGPRQGEQFPAASSDYKNSDASPSQARRRGPQVARTLEDFQVGLQSTLGGERQANTLLDAQGAPIQTDSELQEAVKQGRSSISVSPVDVGTSLVLPLSGNTWGKQEIYAPRTPPVRSPPASSEASSEAMQLLQEERHMRQAEMRQVDERLTSILALVESERICREASVDAMRAQIDTLRAAIDTERASRQQDKRTSDSAMQEVKAEYLREDTLVDVKLKALDKRVQDLIKSERDTLVNGTAMLRRTIDELVSKVERQGRMSFGAPVQVAESDPDKEQSTHAAIPAGADTFTKIFERCDDLEQRLKTVNLEHKQLQDTTKLALNRLTVIESALASTLARSAAYIDSKMGESTETASSESMHMQDPPRRSRSSGKRLDGSPLVHGDVFPAVALAVRTPPIRSPSAPASENGGFNMQSTSGPAVTPAGGGRLLMTPLMSPGDSAVSSKPSSRPGSVAVPMQMASVTAPMPMASVSAPTSQRSSSAGGRPTYVSRGVLSPPRALSPPVSARASGGRGNPLFGSAKVSSGTPQYVLASPRMSTPTLDTYASRGQGRGAEG